METLHNGFTLEICDGAFPLSTDSIALADFAKLPRNARVLDLGSGCGTLGLLLCATYNTCQVTGVELDERAHQMALQNARANQIANRHSSICADISDVPSLFAPGSFTTCISNPPYFTGGFPSKVTPFARQETLCTLDTLFKSASWGLQYGGDFFLVHRPERLAEIFVCGAQYQLEPKRLSLLRHTWGKAVSLVLIQFRKGAKPGLIWEDACLYLSDGTPTDYQKKLYH